MLHYLLVGGCGFLGFHLSRRLLSNGHRVTAVDALRTPQSSANASELRDWALHRLIRHDATQPLSGALRVPRPWDVERVIVTCQDPEATLSPIIEWALDPPISWARPTERWRPPRILVVSDARKGKKDPGIRRVILADAYGPRMESHHWLWDVIERVGSGESIRVGKGTGRSTIHIEDATTALYKAVNVGKAPPTIVLGGSEHWTERALVEAVASRFDTSPKIQEHSDRRGWVGRGDDYALLGDWRPSTRLQPSFGELQAWRMGNLDLLAQRYEID